jgi:biopolymer transport protein TolQ
VFVFVLTLGACLGLAAPNVGVSSLPELSGFPAGSFAKVTPDLSFWNLFWSASWVIQLVMIGLIVASLWSWTIIVHKVIRLRLLNQMANQFEELFWSGGALDELYNRLHKKITDPLSAIFCSAMREWQRSMTKVKTSEMQGTLEQRIERVMHNTLNREIQEVESHMGFLASLGSNAVIIGLFGTVLGIINSFEPIATQQNATLATVAPGIAEALFATAIGLVAAIPAAIAYNKISSDIYRYSQRLEGFVNEFGAIISRQLEEQF